MGTDSEFEFLNTQLFYRNTEDEPRGIGIETLLPCLGSSCKTNLSFDGGQT